MIPGVVFVGDACLEVAAPAGRTPDLEATDRILRTAPLPEPEATGRTSRGGRRAWSRRIAGPIFAV